MYNPVMKPNKNTSQEVTAAEAAEIIGCTKSLIIYYARRGDLTPIRKVSNVFLFDRSDVEKLKVSRRKPGRPKTK